MDTTARDNAGIRTFKVRRGRLPAERRDALERLLPVYGVPVAGGPLDPVAVYGRRAPLVLEIGSGMGDHTAAMAAADPDRDYLAAEVHTAGVANLLRHIDQRGLTNLRVAHGDALTLVRERLVPASLDAIHGFFPDPWPKTRHHKRRLFQPATVALLRSRLVEGGVLHTATDWLDYAEAIRAVLSADPELVNTHPGWAPRPPDRPVTKYERRALAAGRRVYELIFQRERSAA